MSSLANVRATRFLCLADSFVTAGSPLDAIHCAELAGKEDPSLWDKIGAVLRAATELRVMGPQMASDDLTRLRWHLQQLEATVSKERQIHACLPQPPQSERAEDSSNQPLPDSLRKDLLQMKHRLTDRMGKGPQRAGRTIQTLLGECSDSEQDLPPDNSSSEPEGSVDPWFSDALSVEHELHNLGNGLYKVGRFEEAIVFYDCALEVRPDLLETYFNRGLAYTRLGRYDQAEADLDQVIRLNESLAEAWYTRGLIREYKQDYESAISDYSRALQVDPNYDKAQEQRKIAREKRDGKQHGPNRRGSDDDYNGVVKDFAPYRVKPDCRLSQVGGHVAVKREFRKILTYLRGGQIMSEWGAELPRGVLLYGEAGVGKTHLARALAGEAECPFYAPPISLILDMYVGNSERNLRNLFQAASEHEHAIVFLDEIDVVASHRRESRQNHEPWQARLAACLLEEMDNLPRRNGRVVVVGATNALDAVDPCFLRPGRFTYVIEVERPGEVGLIEILLICLETAARRAERENFLDSTLEEAVLAPRQQWLANAFQHNQSGVVQVARAAASKELVGDDVREIVRRVVDERVLAGIDGIELGPITVKDLQRHVEEYVSMRG